MFAQVGEAGQSKVLRVEPGIYLVRLGGHLTAAVSNELSEIVKRDHPDGFRAVIYETTPEFTGYDPDLRTLNLGAAGLEGTAHIAIITANPILRMVTATIAIGLRATRGIPMASYSSLESAVEGARDAIRRASHSA
jgi:hypothetical protein